VGVLDLDFPLDQPQNAACPGRWKMYCFHTYVEMLDDGILLGYNLTRLSGGVDLPGEWA
jgi:hypothetical protein